MSETRTISVDYLKKKNVAPEDTNKIHYHPYYEMVIVKNGFVTYATDSGIIRIAEKSIVFMPAHSLHNPFVQNQPYERYRIQFDADYAKGIFQDNLLEYALKKPYIKLILMKYILLLKAYTNSQENPKLINSMSVFTWQ